MSEITELHNPFRSFLKSQGLLYRYSNPTKATSETPGEPDFLCLENGRVLAIELKQPKTGKLSKAQVFRHAEYAKAGCRVWVVNELSLAVNLVTEWRSQGADTIPVNHPAHRPTLNFKGTSYRQRADGRGYDPVKP